MREDDGSTCARGIRERGGELDVQDAAPLERIREPRFPFRGDHERCADAARLLRHLLVQADDELASARELVRGERVR